METIDRMVTDSVQDVVAMLEGMLDKVNQATKKDKDLEKEVWERYMRYANLVCLLIHCQILGNDGTLYRTRLRHQVRIDKKNIQGARS